MKAAAFDYHRATSVDDAIQQLGAADDAKVLAGGQSLVPLLAMRLARPTVLVDLNRLADLAYVRRENGELAIGALTRHRTVETAELVRRDVPLLADALAHVGHVTIRNRGTIGGSIAHGDPAAELPAVAVALDATFRLRGPGGERSVAAGDFFFGYLMTALEPDELLTEIRWPVLPQGTGCAVEELTRRNGDFALVAVFAALTMGADGVCTQARISVAGAAAAPLRADNAEQALIGSRVSAADAGAAADRLAAATDPPNDIHAPADYRREMAAVLGRRAIQRAWAQANRTNAGE
ncbi:FAD binding domain-containing protein [Phytoactinopolyspora limicola]|uniref:FAD binding domain-containing protein n=1 Tax=Phytoactinopolyspora limicola TaxID=2715536 RepID=UPI00140DF824|nr:xanthine dehydrogenase family protein subunit M [Phytoactinopolyspora limicola]